MESFRTAFGPFNAKCRRSFAFLCALILPCANFYVFCMSAYKHVFCHVSLSKSCHCPNSISNSSSSSSSSSRFIQQFCIFDHLVECERCVNSAQYICNIFIYMQHLSVPAAQSDIYLLAYTSHIHTLFRYNIKVMWSSERWFNSHQMSNRTSSQWTLCKITNPLSHFFVGNPPPHFDAKTDKCSCVTSIFHDNGLPWTGLIYLLLVDNGKSSALSFPVSSPPPFPLLTLLHLVNGLTTSLPKQLGATLKQDQRLFFNWRVIDMARRPSFLIMQVLLAEIM